MFYLVTVIANLCLAFHVCAGTYQSITVDGSFDDWTNVPLAYSQSQVSNAVVQYQNLYLANDDNYLYIRFTVYTNANPFTSSQNIFIDADTNYNTGNHEHGIGSDLLIQNGAPYQENSGVFNAGSDSNLSWLSAPAAPTNDFELRISRNTLGTNGLPALTNNTIAIFLESSEGGSVGNEWFPNVTGGLIYTFASSIITTNAPTNTLIINLTSPANNTLYTASANIALSATTSDSSGTVTNVAFYQGNTLLANVTTAPYTYVWTNVPIGYFTLTAVAKDNVGAISSSSQVGVAVASPLLQEIKTVFMIPLENHDWVQKNPDGSPQQIFGNPAAPYVNSLVTSGSSNAAQVSFATHYYSVAMGEHPSEPNYVWSEAGTEFGIHVDNDPSTLYGNIFNNVMHLSGQLTTAGIPWKSYAEDLEYSPHATTSVSGTGLVNPYNGTTEYYYAVKHNPMEFFSDTQNKNVYPLTNFWADLTNNNIGRYNWIELNVYNEMHSALPSGFNYQGTQFTGDQAAIAEGDNCLSIIIPKIMASQAYKDHGAIIVWVDETESTDNTNTTLPLIVLSPLAKGNAYASTLALSHSSTLKTMDEIFGLAFQTNAIPAASIDAQNTGYNYVNGSSASINDLSDLFELGPLIINQPVNTTNAVGSTATFTVNVTATSQINYQWYFESNLLAGQTNSILTIPSIGPSNAGNYQVVVSSNGGSTNSVVVALTVAYQPPTVIGGTAVAGADGFHISFTGPTNQTYEVLASGDILTPLSAWTVVGTGTFNSSNVLFIDSDATNHLFRFYTIKSP
ncbi:MAG TPA: alkaline phosphatase family protein [Verrucomicrobiae bacterium]